MEERDLQWHPGFYAAFRTETEGSCLRLQNEYPLGTKPTVIDVLAKKTEGGEKLTKNIVRMFRRHNIIEYKNPEESVSVNDYYKVLSYAARYIADARHVMEVDPGEVTMTFVCNHYPQKMLQHLQRSYGMNISEEESGIYYLAGTFFPVQIIVIHELDPKKNLWLYSMRRNLTDEELDAVINDYEKHKDDLNYQSVMDLIICANKEKMKGRIGMCKALQELINEICDERVEERVEKEMAERMQQQKQQLEEQAEKEMAERMKQQKQQLEEQAEKEMAERMKQQKQQLEERVEKEMAERIQQQKQQLEERVEKEMAERMQQQKQQLEERVEKEMAERMQQQGERKKLMSMIRKKLQKGKPEKVIAEELEEEVSVIQSLIAQMMQMQATQAM